MDVKDAYTSVFLIAGELPSTEENIKKYKPIWWFNLRSKDYGGLRLTDAGLSYLESINMRKYEIEIPKQLYLNPQILVWMDHQTESPYHLNKKIITVFREKSALELYMFSGDIQKMGYAKSVAAKINSHI